ncbi:hypothetical protein BGX38DRAFT_1292528 [Terfezia claveryi]|nr:hypothetical protein BGX38DRAFT_1292528 [Terfezia claveryi]
MTDTIGIDAPASVDEGPDLRSLLGEHNSVDTVMREATSDSPQIDIPTTTAAVAAAQKAQLQNAASQHEESHICSEQSSAAASMASVMQPASPTLSPLQDIQHQQSPPPAISPGRDMSDHELRLSPLPGDTHPPAQICLCQQPARIPRPRNAFILFRQHNHASVVQANPGKPNPEISKIIGEMWRESSKETKAIWQRHADEEKRQHLARYPEYKYQPRRNGKKSTSALGPAGIPGMMDSALCSTCGGHTGALNTPDTPATPMTATPVSATHPLSAVSKTFRNTYMPTPRTPPASFTQIPPIPKSARRRRKGDGSHAGVEALLQLGLPEQEEGELSPTNSSPQNPQASKKRRLNVTSPTSGGDVMIEVLRTPRSSVPLVFGQDPNIDPFLKHTNLHERSFGGSESPPAISGGPGNSMSFSPTASGEDALKAIPALSKLQAIAKICRPLPAPELNSGASPRGAIIAIEGDDTAAVKSLCDSLAETLKGELVEIIEGKDAVEETSSPEEKNPKSGGYVIHSDNMQDFSGGEFTLSDDDLGEEGVKTAKYLKCVADWRLYSYKMRRKVLPTLPHSDNPEAHGSQLLAATNPATRNQQSPSSSQASGKLPILLLNRYILSRTDSAAANLPKEGLTPLQHWQWAASIWKGCVGADMTILVKTDGPAGGDGVEVKDPGKVLVARKDVGKEWDGGRVRRLGFEVNECVRSLMGVNS